MAGWTAHAEQDVFLGLVADNVRTKKADVVATDQMGIRRILDVRTLATHSPHAMELKAAQAAKEKQYAGIPVQDPQASDSPDKMVPLIHCLCGPIGDQAAQLMLTLIPHVCNVLFNKGAWNMGKKYVEGSADLLPHAGACAPQFHACRLRYCAGERARLSMALHLSLLWWGGAPPEPAKPHMMIPLVQCLRCH